LKVKPEEQHSEVTAEENRLINLISEFYDQKINAIMNCKTDLDVMPLFSSDYVICNQLESFLKEKGVSERLINSFVNQFFSTLELLGI
jgi:predicted ATPase